MDLNDRVAVVTGGRSGIGAALCRRFSDEGAWVVVVDLHGADAEAVASEVSGSAAKVDVVDETAVQALVESVLGDHGRIDLFCHNAGIAVAGSVDRPNSDWQRAWDVNVMAHIHATRAVLPSMLDRGEGYLLHTASAAGLLMSLGAAPYSVTKHAVVALAEWLAVVYGPHGIKVSCLCPQFVTTRMLAD
jgi:NAD(P)-dependent dehydrogenase (short-subunit alcohol dehydrogenase family)